MKVVVWLLIASWGLAIILTGIILLFQERSIRGYIEHPYWQIGYIFIFIGAILMIIALIKTFFTLIED
ncbi:MAG: hypothetical protein QXG76_00265 [Candidatus Bathyarchaeia archaeon]